MRIEAVSFPSAGGTCCGAVYRPGSIDQEALPVVVMAHGISGTRLTQYDRRARRLVEAGVAVLDFDPRFVGTSPGEPRQRIDPLSWLDDLRAALGYARGRPDLDAQAVGLYGSSLGGGCAFALAAEDPGIRAIALDVPMLDGLLATPSPIRERWPLVSAVARDVAARVRGRPPVLVPVFGELGSGAVLQYDVDGFWRAMDELDGIEWVEPQRVARHHETGEWRNEATALELVNVVRVRPAKRAADVRCAVLVHISEDDRVVSPRVTRKTLARVSGADIRTVRGGHFGPFYGDGFETTVSAEIEFFARELHAG
jgi:fermentation-respiration switch protein FrsA (DUF1100 family)